MKDNGAVICFQKYMPGNMPEDKKNLNPICLGYFNRAEVKTVSNFRDYVRLVSKHDADQACSRKQLLLRKLRKDENGVMDKLHKQIELCDFSKRKYKNYTLPFVRIDDENSKKSNEVLHGICCCTAINVTNSILPSALLDFADLMYDGIAKYQEEIGNFGFAIEGLLGTEDLCLIVLADRFDTILEVHNIVQRTSNDLCCVSNSHSIVMLNTTQVATIVPESWKNTQAEIRFSLRAENSKSFLQNLCKYFQDRSEEPVEMMECTGEYDVAVRCPAHLLHDLFGPQCLLNSSNEEYRKCVYQTETVLYSKGGTLGKTFQEKITENYKRPVKDKQLEKVVSIAVNELCKIFNTDQNDNDFDYFELPMWRLLKEYWCFAAFPYNKELHEDIYIQFKAAINSIVVEAQKAKENGNSSKVFVDKFNQIITALSSSMQAVSQMDRLNFGEQQTYTHNVGVYYKVLRCYYGIVKDIIKLVYGIKRYDNQKQQHIVPLISFAVTTIIKSNAYDSVIDNRNVRLIYIQLPYQAIANPPKYLGILAHEVFHYAAPSIRWHRNELLIDQLLKVAITELLSIFAKATGYAKSIDYAMSFCAENNGIIDGLLSTWKSSQPGYFDNSDLNNLTLSKLKFDIMPQHLYFDKDKSCDNDIYYLIWSWLRSALMCSIDECNEHEIAIFGLEKETETVIKMGDRAFVCREKAKSTQEIYSGIKQKIPQESVCEFNRLLINTIGALEEIPPDIFDIMTVMPNISAEEQLEQYLWQIFGTKREIMSDIDLDNAIEGKDDETQTIMLLQEDIRVNFIIEYLLRKRGTGTSVEDLHECLKNWVPKENAHQDRFEVVKKRYIRNYQLYMARFEHVSQPAMELCEMVMSEASFFNHNKETGNVIKKLSGFYAKYYKLLSEKHNGLIDKDVYTDKLYVLCDEIINSYQYQESINTLCETSATHEKTDSVNRTMKSFVEKIENYCSAIAYKSTDLPNAILLGYTRMSIKGNRPVLWYRGQRKYAWKTLPNIMRTEASKQWANNGFKILSEEYRWAKAKILPTGSSFVDPDWLAFLQHNEFKTNILDFSEALHPSLYFATEEWADEPGKIPEADASIMMLNPILFNLAMEALDEQKKGTNGGSHFGRLKHYLETGKQNENDIFEPPLFAEREELERYDYLFNWQNYSNKEGLAYPRAALVPKNCERMEKQSGQFIFYDLKCEGDKGTTEPYAMWSIESLHEKYQRFIESKGLAFVPFMFKIALNRFRYEDFKEYLRTIGMQKFQVYPEWDKLSENLIKQLQIK